MDFLLKLLQALERQGVRSVVVGGVAVVLHGHPRLTVDLDLVVDLESDNFAPRSTCWPPMGWCRGFR